MPAVKCYCTALARLSNATADKPPEQLDPSTDLGQYGRCAWQYSSTAVLQHTWRLKKRVSSAALPVQRCADLCPPVVPCVALPRPSAGVRSPPLRSLVGIPSAPAR